MTTPRFLNVDSQLRPDGLYGLSKAFGELTGRLYRDKHGVESVAVRIGSSYPEAQDARMLATWLSHGDLTRLMIACCTAPRRSLSGAHRRTNAAFGVRISAM